MQNERFLLFPGFRLKALTFSYDDCVNEDVRLVETFRKNSLKGTFNINSELLGRNGKMTLEEAKALYGDDMEVALHGAQHLPLKKMSTAVAMRDVLVDRENLERGFGKIIRGMAYAYGSYNEEVVEMLRDAGIAYSRTTKNTNKFNLPDDWLTLHPTCHHSSEDLDKLTEEFIAPVDESSSSYWRINPKLFYVWGHSYEFRDNNNWELIEKFCELMGKQKDVWFATNIEIYSYVKAFESLVFSSDLTFVENPSATDVYLKVNKKKIVAKAGELTRL